MIADRSGKWRVSNRADPIARNIADRHYNRQKVDSPQFVPPGRGDQMTTNTVAGGDDRLIQRALELVRDGLRSGQIPADRFNMGEFGGPECGTAGCIGAWLFALFNQAEIDWPQRHDLGTLFCPHATKDWSRITPAQGADAIQRYLNGKVPWPSKAA